MKAAHGGRMAGDRLRYERLVEDALRGVVRQALQEVALRGLPGEHHFYITFRTGDGGVDIPDVLRTQYPQEMTIVLQHQFWGLEVEPQRFAVTLSFNNRQERLVVPFAAITGFADPSVKFGLQFETGEAAAQAIDGRDARRPAESDDAKKTADVLTLDAFRKK